MYPLTFHYQNHTYVDPDETYIDYKSSCGVKRVPGFENERDVYILNSRGIGTAGLSLPGKERVGMWKSYRIVR